MCTTPGGKSSPWFESRLSALFLSTTMNYTFIVESALGE